VEEATRKHPKIGIFGHYGNQNLGDEAIIEATIQNLRRLIPNVELVGLSINPEDTQTRYNIDAFPIRYNASFFKRKNTEAAINNDNKGRKPPSDSNQPNALAKKSPLPVRIVRGVASRLYHGTKNLVTEISFLRACKKQASELDLLIVCGSNQFLDNFGGPWGFPYTLLKWTLLAKSVNTKVAFVSVGAGPIYKKLSFKLLAQALRRADYLSYRDIGSKKLIEENITGVSGKVYPDVAHSLLTPSTPPNDRESKIIAINPMPVFDPRYWYTSDTNKLDHYINAMAKFTISLIDQGYHVVLFNTQKRDLDSIEDIRNKIQTIDPSYLESERFSISKHELVNELLQTLSSSDIVVATRFHATVLPLRLGKPTFGISYHRKANELLEDVGLKDCYVNIDNFSYEELSEKFSAFLNNTEQHSNSIGNKFTQYKQQLDEQWQAISELLPYSK